MTCRKVVSERLNSQCAKRKGSLMKCLKHSIIRGDQIIPLLSPIDFTVQVMDTMFREYIHHCVSGDTLDVLHFHHCGLGCRSLSHLVSITPTQPWRQWQFAISVDYAMKQQLAQLVIHWLKIPLLTRIRKGFFGYTSRVYGSIDGRFVNDG